MSATRIERMGHLMFAIMCLAVSAAAVQYVVVSRTAATPTLPKPVAADTKVTLPPEASGEASVPALMLVLNSQCRFCTESMPFYTRLLSLPEVTSGRLRISAVAFEPESTMRTYLERHSLEVSAIVPIASTGISVTGTPAIVLVRPDGTVADSWDGRLNAEQEQDVVRAVEKLTRS